LSSPLEIATGVAVEVLIFALAGGVLLRLWGHLLPLPTRATVPAFHQGVVMRSGKVEGVRSSGSYWLTPGRSIMLCDQRPRPFQIAAQEMLAADGMGIRVSLGGEYKIIDPGAFVTHNTDSFGAFYLEVRQALRSAVSEVNGQIALLNDGPISTRMKELLVPRAAHLGLEMTQLEVWEAVPIGWVRQA